MEEIIYSFEFYFRWSENDTSAHFSRYLCSFGLKPWDLRLEIIHACVGRITWIKFISVKTENGAPFEKWASHSCTLGDIRNCNQARASEANNGRNNERKYSLVAVRRLNQIIANRRPHTHAQRARTHTYTNWRFLYLISTDIFFREHIEIDSRTWAIYMALPMRSLCSQPFANSVFIFVLDFHFGWFKLCLTVEVSFIQWTVFDGPINCRFSLIECSMPMFTFCARCSLHGVSYEQHTLTCSSVSLSRVDFLFEIEA